MRKINTLFFLGLVSLIFLIACSKSTPAPKPTAGFSFTSSSTTAPSLVTFTNISINASSFTWDFGDNSNSTMQNPTHTYNSGGSYVVKLIANGAGGVDSTKQTVTISNPTALQIKVIDNLGNPIVGATVKLYPSQLDYLNVTNQVLTTQLTNSQGIVTFQPLNPSKYYWNAYLDCKTNIFGSATTANNLVPNTINTVQTILNSTSILTLANNSTNPYSVSFDGSILNSSMAGNSSTSYPIPSGNHTIVVTQLNGYVLTPTVKTYSINPSCGQTLTQAFPN
jgi:PKD repeat protein